MAEDPIVLVSCCDRSYLPHLATVMRSLALSQNRIERWYLFLDETVPLVERRTLQTFAHGCHVNVELRSIPSDLLAGFPAERPSTPIVWLRPMLPELLPDETRVLSLDCDTLVLHDLRPLWQTALELGSYFAAVTQPTYRYPNPMLDRLGIPSNQPYFNAGVLLMDLDLMRADDLTGQTRAFVSSSDRPHLPYNEQDALNLLFADRWTPLDPTWNAMTAVLMPFVEGGTWEEDTHHDAWILERAARSPAIVHFEGAALLKPWCVRCFNPFASMYRQLRATTPWPLRELEGRRHDALVARTPLRFQWSVWLAELKLATARQHLRRRWDGRRPG